MKSKIPPSEFNQIIQTKSSPETIVALLNERETFYSKQQSNWHANRKRTFPFWKACQVCLRPFPCKNTEQATRNKTCGKACWKKALSGQRKRLPMDERKGMVQITCPVCGRKIWRFRSHIKRYKVSTCSKPCLFRLRSQWAKEGKIGKAICKGHPALSGEAKKRRADKMRGSNNPAWKGGITYFKTKGNYKGVKYVRCPQEFIAMARKDGYVMEHRLLVAQQLRRPLLRTEVVHHRDHDPTNNDLGNLQLFASNMAHKKYEGNGSPEPIWQL